jgi:hypothetical protein
VTRQLNDPDHLSRPVGASKLREARTETSRRPKSALAFGLALGLLTTAMLGCMTVTQILTPVSATPGQAGATPEQPAATPGTVPSHLPTFEHDYNKTLQLLGTGEARRLVELSAEGQQQPMYQAGTQKYTVSMESTQIVDLGYDWCTKTSAILSDNDQHITVSVTINGYEIPSQDFQAIDWSVAAGSDPTFPEGLVCHSWVILASSWPPGEYQVSEVATFDSKINDGYDDYGAGAYRYEYTVEVNAPGPSASGGTGRSTSWNDEAPALAWRGP